MALRLSDRDRRMLAGDMGEGARMALAIIVRMAEVQDAPELMDVSLAHIDGCGLLSDASVEFAERLAGTGARVSVPTTLNMGPLDLQHWHEFGVAEDHAAMGIRQAQAYEGMGCVPTWTCAPYQGYLTPRFGQQIAWGESNAVAYANSVCGARTNRYADYIDICAAVAGRAPRVGLHLTENRRGNFLLRLDGFSFDDTFYPAFGYFLGRLAGARIPVIEGLPPTASGDQLKALCAAAASSGELALFHAVGVTPEAPTCEAAFQGAEPDEVMVVTPSDLAGAYDALSTAEEGDALDLVVLGCPHYSYDEFRRLVACIREVEGTSRIPFVVLTGTQSHALALRSGLLAEIEAFGGRVGLDTCVFHTPMVSSDAQVVMTDSGKCSYYAPGELDVRVAFGSLADCVRSAVAGRVCRRDENRHRSSSSSNASLESHIVPERQQRVPSLTTHHSSLATPAAARGRDATIQGKVVIAGQAEGVALVTAEPLSFWGGIDTATGEIIDRRHERSGACVAGRVFVLPSERGSSTGSAVLLECVRAGVAPAAILTTRVAPIIALGAIIADEMYGKTVPMAVLTEADLSSIRDGDRVTLGEDGTVVVDAG